MDNHNKVRPCLYCSKELKGRKDKKFCNDGCRNTFHNDLNSPTREMINPIINILKRNRAIILELLSKDELLVDRENLLKAGLDFRYHTSITEVDSDRYYFYFDVGLQDSGTEIFRLWYKAEFKSLL